MQKWARGFHSRDSVGLVLGPQPRLTPWVSGQSLASLTTAGTAGCADEACGHAGGWRGAGAAGAQYRVSEGLPDTTSAVGALPVSGRGNAVGRGF